MDWDFIAQPDELDRFHRHPELKPVGKHDGPKRDFSYGRTYVEVELALPGSSAESLLWEHEGMLETPFGPAYVASLDTLLLLKQSHIGFRRMWPKHFADYKLLQEHAGSIPARMKPVLDKRIEETKKRLRFRDRKFDVSNKAFFEQSATRVSRVVEHDSIHEAIKLGDAPIYKMLKEDQSSAVVLFSKFESLSFELKIQNMQEECMALVIERHAIPAHLAGSPARERKWVELILREMCFNFLPFDFRQFCVDYFEVIRDTLPWGFTKKAISQLGIEQAPLASTGS